MLVKFNDIMLLVLLFAQSNGVFDLKKYMYKVAYINLPIYV